jgi:hypothetical protein
VSCLSNLVLKQTCSDEIILLKQTYPKPTLYLYHMIMEISLIIWYGGPKSLYLQLQVLDQHPLMKNLVHQTFCRFQPTEKISITKVISNPSVD